MQVTILGKERPAWVGALAVLLLAALSYAHFLVFFNRGIILVCAVAMIVMFARGDLRRLWNLPTVLLLGYAGYTALSACWAIAGKFFLKQFTRFIPAVTVFLALVLYRRAEKGLVRRVMAAVAGVSAIFSILSIEAASTRLLRSFVFDTLNAEGIDMAFKSRLYGAFGNSNIEAAIFAIGIFFSLALLLDAEDKRLRAVYAASAAICAFSFVLLISMGATACFIVAVVVYLIASGKGRGAALARMLLVAVPSLLFSVASTRFFNADGALRLLPLALLALNAAVAALLERRFAERLADALSAHEKALYGAIFGLLAALVVFFILAMRVSAPYTFGGGLSRAVALAPGEHTLTLDASGTVSTRITSKNSAQVLTGTQDTLFSGTETQLRFTVPEGSVVVWFYFSADEGTTLQSATLDGGKPLMLRYRLLPAFVANRLQGTLTSSSSVMLRRMLWRDGLRFWRVSPVFGSGMGSFETGITLVQDFDYETKFPHNHYVQVLLEGGVIGFALFVGALGALGAALWKRRRALREGPYAALYAAFAAEFVMNALHMIWDIQMTNSTFLWQTYAFYALIVLLCAEPLGQKQSAAADALQTADAVSGTETTDGAEATGAAAGAADGTKSAKPAKDKKAGKKGGKKAPAKPAVRAEIRYACMVIPAFLAVTMCGNIIARHLIEDLPPTLVQYLGQLERAAKIDLYEHSDAQLNYVLQVAQYEGTEQYRPKADAYAEQLGKLHSNSIHMYLTQYYINTQQYEKAVDMVLLTTVYAASDESMWNDDIDLLQQSFFERGLLSPLLYDDNAARILPKLMQFYDAWQTRNATALMPIKLTPEHEDFFDTVLALNACNGDTAAMAMVLSSR